MTDPIESLIKGMLQTAESSVRSLFETEWSAEDQAAGRPTQEFFRSAARGIADTMSSVRASIPAIEPGKRSAQAAVVADELDRLRGRQEELEEEQDELAEHVDRMMTAQRHAASSPYTDDEPLPDHIILVYRFVTASLLIGGASQEEIRRCILNDGKSPVSIPGRRQVRREILKARRTFGQAEVEAVRERIVAPSVFSILFTCVAAEQHRLRERSERFDA